VYTSVVIVKGLVHPKMKILSSFTHSPQEDSLKNLGNQTCVVWKSMGPSTTVSGYPHSSNHLLLCSADERNSYRLGSTRG